MTGTETKAISWTTCCPGGAVRQQCYSAIDDDGDDDDDDDDDDNGDDMSDDRDGDKGNILDNLLSRWSSTPRVL